MKKRALSFLLILVMVLSLIPTVAMADESNSQENGNDNATEQPVEPAQEKTLQTRINALPTAEELEIMEADEQETAYAEVSAIYDALEELSEEELAEIDQTTLEAAAAFFNQQVMPLEEPEEPVIETAIYVSASGSDDNDGTAQDKAVATLAKAVEIAQDGATIYVMSDLTINKCARFYNKNLTITSGDDGPYTVTRGDNFETQSDTGRSWYNPAMIEAQANTEGGEYGLTLENIILDDDGKHMGTVFAQAVSGVGEGNESNLVYVQDAMIASNATVPCTITLGEGAILCNFGGMSAVRVTDQAKLVMESGSKIEDTTVTDHEKGVSGSVGPAGAIWVQSASVEMKTESEISNVVGRAIYVDNGTVILNGTISDIKSDPDMWNGCQGIALHLRGGASASVGGMIQNVKSEDNNSVVIYGDESSFVLEAEGTIQNCSGTGSGGYGGLIYVNLHKPTTQPNAPYFNLNGVITHCSAPKSLIFTANSSEPVVVGRSAVITQNTCGTVFYENTAANMEAPMEINGTVTENTCTGSMFVGGNNGRAVILGNGAKINNNTLTENSPSAVFWFGANRRIIMEDGSEVCNNTIENGAVVTVNGEGNCFTMNGGTVSGNIVGNGSLFAFTSGSWNQPCTFAINGGTISGNDAPHVLTVTSGQSKEKVPNIFSYLLVTENSPKDVYFQEDGKTVTVNAATKLGNADGKQSKYSIPDVGVGNNPRCINLLNTAAASYGCKDAFATFWAQNADGTPVAVQMDAPAEGEEAKFDIDKSVYALILATDEKGAPAQDAEVKVLPATVADDGTIRFTLPGNANGYAVGLVQINPNAAKGTLTLSTTVTELTEGRTPYEVPYTATFMPKEGLTFGEICKVEFISPLTGDGKTASLDANNTAKWTGTLADEAFKAGQNIDALAVLTVTIDKTQYKILSNSVSTKMVGLLTVTFDANGGTFADGSNAQAVRAESGSTVSLPTNPTRSGYTFTGWNTQADGKGTAFMSSNVVNSDLTVYAQWQKKSSDSSKGSSKPATKLNTEDHYSYIIGYKDGTLRPYGTITRGEVATIFFRLLTDETRDAYWSQTNNYSDCGSDLWCNNAISTLSNMGIIDGYADGTFRPYGKITRAQFAKMAVGFFETATKEYQGYYSDVPEDAWYTDYVEAASRVGLIQGFQDGTFRPDANITRAQACVIVNRALNRKPDEDHLLPEKEMITWTDNNPGDWFYADMQEATNSHDYTWLSKGSEKKYMEDWTKKLEQRDWAAFEHAWSTAHSAPGGEVVK